MLTVIFIILHVFTCTHDIDQDALLREMPPKQLKKPQKITTDTDIPERKEIRVHFDMSSIGAPEYDSLQCTSAGQTKVISGKSIVCQETDVLTSSKITIIKETMENAKSYITRLIKVTPYDRDINIASYQSNVNPSRTVETDCDLFIAVLARPFGSTSSTLASAGSTSYSSGSYSDPLDVGRPITGRIQINPSKLPLKAENENSGNRQFFVTCLHELMHVLAFSSSLFYSWVNRSSNSKYTSPVISFQNNFNLQQSFIRTPELLNWVNKRFQVDDPTISGFGLELEDGGGSGTAGSHPNERLYFTDIMQGRTYGPGYFSAIYFHTFHDSGWYEPNYTMQEELVYLNMEIISEAPNQYILTEPPKLTFPESYFCTSTTDSYCFYDYSHKANCELQTLDEMYRMEVANGMSNINSTLKWYSPDGGLVGTDNLLDYAPILIPNNANCRDESLPETDADISTMAGKLRETYSTTSVCAISKIFKGKFGEVMLGQATGCYKARCGEDLKIRFTLQNTAEQLCEYEGQKLYPKGSTQYIICPNAKAACATLPKTKMVTVEMGVPDRGPHTGGFYIGLNGFNLLSYQSHNLKFFIGDIQLEEIDFHNNSILTFIPSGIEEKTKSFLELPQTLYIYGDGDPNVTIIEDFFTFLKR
ncbi:hypothetical protein TRFO_20432 [Tritrichomonas foetus]|uniref:GP63-like n=1 Tax=Tritrichomonas foetus TaxID=1144522 RepID=A0A1J4KHF8_9EUKA|nr:hypothetical protein TRFO_20432 [Tritrichomonas foetus]|eukprot:OHT10376.1 hypothetical protein TRFO_20432 [Tritrichomonas foetus]